MCIFSAKPVDTLQMPLLPSRSFTGFSGSCRCMAKREKILRFCGQAAGTLTSWYELSFLPHTRTWAKTHELNVSFYLPNIVGRFNLTVKPCGRSFIPGTQCTHTRFANCERYQQRSSWSVLCTYRQMTCNAMGRTRTRFLVNSEITDKCYQLYFIYRSGVV